jgi:hypothetical protein
MSEPTANDLRKRLVDIDDEIRGLSDDAFARRHELLTESDACRNALFAEVGLDIDKANKEWADRAGHKGEHEVDYDVLKGLIISAVPDSSSQV